MACVSSIAQDFLKTVPRHFEKVALATLCSREEGVIQFWRRNESWLHIQQQFSHTYEALSRNVSLLGTSVCIIQQSVSTSDQIPVLHQKEINNETRNELLLCTQSGEKKSSSASIVTTGISKVCM